MTLKQREREDNELRSHTFVELGICGKAKLYEVDFGSED